MANDQVRRTQWLGELPDELAVLPRFPSIDAFYSDSERRRRSPEWDYGVHWRAALEVAWPHWRVSWVAQTGDVYAVQTARQQPVVLLGCVPSVGDYPFRSDHWAAWARQQPIERVLAGWAQVDPPLLLWVRFQLVGAEK